MAPETEDTLLGRARFLCREDSAQPHLFLMLRKRRFYRKDEEAGPKVQWPHLGPQGDGEIYGWAGDEMHDLHALEHRLCQRSRRIVATVLSSDWCKQIHGSELFPLALRDFGAWPHACRA